MSLDNFNELIKTGNIAFYESCEITEIFLIKKKEKIIYNFFTIAVFEEKKNYTLNKNFICDKPVTVDDDYSIGICQYNIDIKEARDKYEELLNRNLWGIDGTYSTFPMLKSISKQYIPSTDGKRLNSILKNNFYQGSYILEFFDEEKTYVDFLLKIDSLKKFNKICEKITEFIPIDLSVVRDRVGNFIFQFPITILDVNSRALSTWDGINVTFSWHNQLNSLPDCLIQLESKLDNNYMGFKIEEYNKQKEQIINIGNLDQKTEFKVVRKEPSLILSYYSGNYIRDFNFNIGVGSQNKRLFEIEGITYEVDVSSYQRNSTSKEEIYYNRYISNNLYDIEKKQLEKSLSFKQYKGIDNNIALNDIRKLIEKYDKSGVYLWDPYLRAKDIFNTLYHAKTINTELKAIASTNSNTAKVFGQNGMQANQVINDQKILFENPNHNNYGLNFEFRIQHGTYGWKFHDRFLIFPGDDHNRPRVYALGTSVNSFGNEHNILQEVSHPQPVVDAFNELWNQLNNQDCLVWKFPK